MAAKPARTKSGRKSATRTDKRAPAVPPYGPPIWDALARGDIAEMKAVADAARRVLFPVKFSEVSGEKAAEAKRALVELEAAIAKIERRD